MAKTNNIKGTKNANKISMLRGNRDLDLQFNQLNNLMVMEDLSMKSATYKKQNGKVVEIINNNSTLEDRFLNAYNQAVIDIKRGRYTFTLDSLQDAITAILSRIDSIELASQDSAYHYLISACSKREKHCIRQAISFDLMKDIQCEYFIENSGISETYVSEAIQAIKGRLTDNEYQVFSLYHIAGYTLNEVALKLDTYHKDIAKKLEVIAGKIDTLKIAYLYDNRYVAYQSKKKKRQHKREVLQHKDYIKLSGMVFKGDIENYKPIENNPIDIPKEKCLSYATKEYFEIKATDYAYRDETNTNEFILVSNLALQI